MKPRIAMVSAVRKNRMGETLLPNPGGKCHVPGCLLNADLLDLPHSAPIVGLALQNRVTVKRIDHEERALVIHGHVFAIALEGEDRAEELKILGRNVDA